MSKPMVCIKIGGRAAEDDGALSALAAELASLQAEYVFFLVHGGGTEVSRISSVLGLEPRFEDGKRMTSPEEMLAVDMVLAGSMNKKLVRMFRAHGLDAVGVSGADGGLILGSSINGDTRTGVPETVNPRLVLHLQAGGMVPIVSPVSSDENGDGLNINADDAALALAASIPVQTLVFVSDIPGVLREGTVIPRLTADEAEDQIRAGVISGGMIPKVRASAGALEKGISSVIIGGYTNPGDLRSLISGSTGTTIHRRNI